MTRISTYRHVAAALAAIFLLFNVGLPVVVASCPMSETRTPACSMCPGESGTQSLSRAKNTSCCTTVIAAEKNSTEFVHLKYRAAEDVKVVVIAFEVPDFSAQASQVVAAIENRAPALFIDIPILTSSLLI